MHDPPLPPGHLCRRGGIGRTALEADAATRVRALAAPSLVADNNAAVVRPVLDTLARRREASILTGLARERGLPLRTATSPRRTPRYPCPFGKPATVQSRIFSGGRDEPLREARGGSLSRWRGLKGHEVARLPAELDADEVDRPARGAVLVRVAPLA